jgi:hypothetical protein
MVEHYIASLREAVSLPSVGCLIEFEDVFAACCNATILPVRNGRDGRATLPVDLPTPRGESLLLVVTMSPAQVPWVLDTIPDWRSRFDRVAAYVFDAVLHPYEAAKPGWRRRLSHYSRTFSRLDHLFIPFAGHVDDWRHVYGRPVSYLPMACDVVRFGSGSPHRSIDVMGYGRQHLAHSFALAEAYNDPESPRSYYFTEHMDASVILDFRQHRRFFWKFLTRSRIGLAYDVLAVNPGGRFPFSFVSQRWFELIAAGCLVAGRRPTCPEADALLDWEDATVELPEPVDEMLETIETLLADTDRLEAAHRRNHAQALARHDWRYRTGDLLDALELLHPDGLRRQLDALHARREAIGAV